jgi:hypothetical protein
LQVGGLEGFHRLVGDPDAFLVGVGVLVFRSYAAAAAQARA